MRRGELRHILDLQCTKDSPLSIPTYPLGIGSYEYFCTLSFAN